MIGYTYAVRFQFVVLLLDFRKILETLIFISNFNIFIS